MPSDSATKPIPETHAQAHVHPLGYRVVDDAPVHLAPAVDVRAVVKAGGLRYGSAFLPGGSMIPPSAIVELRPEHGDPGDPGGGATSVRFSLAFPVEERIGGEIPREPIVPPPDRKPDGKSEATPQVRSLSSMGLHAVTAPIVRAADDAATGASNTRPQSLVEAEPSTAPFERRRQSPLPTPAHDEMNRADAAERDALLRDLAAMGPLDERADRMIDRSVAARATLARARALRFRLALHDIWPAPPGPTSGPASSGPGRLLGDVVGRVRAVVPRPLHVDLSIEVALLVSVADGAPHGTSDASLVAGFARDRATLMVLTNFLLAHRPDLARTALRDRGTATIARLTIVGWSGAIASLERAASTLTLDTRRSAIDLAARIAATPSLNEHRVGALGDIEAALLLPTGAAAEALAAERGSPDDM